MLYIIFSQFKKYIGPYVRFKELIENTIKSKRVSCKTACVRNKRNICTCNSVPKGTNCQQSGVKMRSFIYDNLTHYSRDRYAFACNLHTSKGLID